MSVSLKVDAGTETIYKMSPETQTRAKRQTISDFIGYYDAIKRGIDAINKSKEPRKPTENASTKHSIGKCSRRKLNISTAGHSELRHVVAFPRQLNIWYCAGKLFKLNINKIK